MASGMHTQVNGSHALHGPSAERRAQPRTGGGAAKLDWAGLTPETESWLSLHVYCLLQEQNPITAAQHMPPGMKAISQPPCSHMWPHDQRPDNETEAEVLSGTLGEALSAGDSVSSHRML